MKGIFSKSSHQSHIMLCINKSVLAGNFLEGVLSAIEANVAAKGLRGLWVMAPPSQLLNFLF